MDTRVNVPTRPEVASGDELSEWLEYAGSDLSDRLKELSDAMFKLSVDHPTIDEGDEETAGIFTENLRMIAALRDAVEEFHQKEKAPYWTLGKRVDAWFNGFIRALDGMADPLRSALSDFAIRRQKSQIFAEPEPVRGVYGGRASVKTTWTYEVEDITKVPVEYLSVNERMIKAVLMDRDPKTKVPRRTIPGIKWVKQQGLAVS